MTATPLRCYRVTTVVRVVHQMATSFSSAVFAVRDRYPGEHIMSVLLDHDEDVPYEP